MSDNHFIVIHKHVDALQEELGTSTHESGKHLTHCEHVAPDLSNKLTMGFQDIDSKITELTIDDMFIKRLQCSVESLQDNLTKFRSVYTVFHEKSFVPLVGNVDANNLFLNELGKDITSIWENLHSLTQDVHKLCQTVYSSDKGVATDNSKELTQLKRDVSNLKTRVSEFIDLCQQMGCFNSLSSPPVKDSQVGNTNVDSDALVVRLTSLEQTIQGLVVCMDNVETLCRQFNTQTGKMADDMCCNACMKIADNLDVNTKNIDALYTALLSKGLLMDKMGEHSITNFRDG